MFPVSAYRCVGVLRCSASPEQLAQIAFDMEHRRKWDLELTRETRTMDKLSEDTVFEYEARGSSMGGVVSGRGFVDIRGRAVKSGEARVYWGSYKWDVEMDDGLVRAWNYTSGVSFKPVESQKNTFKMTIIRHVDVKGWLPYAAAEKAMSGSIGYWYRLLADYIQKQHPIEK